MKKIAPSLLVLVAFSSFAHTQPLPPDNPNRINQLRSLKVVPLVAAKQTIKAWIMDNESKREEGMMFLKAGDVKENQAMIFVFPTIQPSTNSFWMHNCPAGLDIVYVGKNHKVLNVGDGKPESDSPVKAAGDYQFVIELVPGWSKKHGLKKGDLVTIPATLKTSK